METVLSRLGLEVVSVKGSEIQSYCPGHKTIKGKEDSNPSWYINADTGAHICFSCGYKGSLMSLICDVKQVDYADAKDWFYLENKLGGEDIAAIDMKSDKKGVWEDFDFFDLNASGFSAFPIGYVTEKGKLSNVGIHAYWWSSTEQNEKQAIGRAIGINEDNVYKGFASKEDGLTIRCIRYIK